MGDLNLDDLLGKLGDPDPHAPMEPSPTCDVNLAGEGSLQTAGPSSATDQIATCPDAALADIYTPEEVSGPSDDLGEELIKGGALRADQVATARRVLKQTPGKRAAEAYIETGADETAVQEIVARLAGLPFERVDFAADDPFDHKAFKRLGLEYCKQNLVMPLRREGSRLVVGTASPDDLFLLDEVRRKVGVTSIKHTLVTAYDIRGVIETFSEAEADDIDIDEILADVDEDDVEVEKEDTSDKDFFEDADSSPVVRYVNHIIQTALKEGASDIHIEPGERKLKVRFRIDGILFGMMDPPHKMHAALTSRIKIMANLDIAERRLPQDGRIRVTVLGRKLDLRVSTLPTAHGEKTVVRILDNRSIKVGLDELGFQPDTLTIWKNQITQPHGIILVTGPTGSGKTTTLYSSLHQLDISRLNVSTVEDPVEYNLAGITQVQTHEKIGMSFGAVLRSLLRQDPDVIMVGEIRDLETATIASQAALTGHLVLSTLHTNDAPSSITRLINIGLEPFLVGAALNSVLAQRLVRRICANCVEQQSVSDEMVDFLVMHGITASTLGKGKGCSRCRETGYHGRVGLYEMLLLDDFLRDEVAKNPNVTEFRRICTERGMVTLREDGFVKVQDGRTSVEEVLRVTESTI